MSTVLLTGGTGFLGSHLVEKLVKEKYPLILLKRSFSDLKRIEKNLHLVKTYDINTTDLEYVFSENNIHTIIHCATDYGKNDSDADRVENANYNFPTLLLEWAKKKKCSRFINTDTILLSENSNYALYKKKFLEVFKSYTDNFSCINIRTEQFYGPGDNESQFIPYLIRELLNNAKEIRLTAGEQERGFLFMDDLVNAYTKIIRATEKYQNGFYNYEIGACEKIKIKYLVALIKKMTGNHETHLNFGAIPYRENELMNYELDISEIKYLGWAPQTSLEQGIKKTIEYHMNRN